MAEERAVLDFERSQVRERHGRVLRLGGLALGIRVLGAKRASEVSPHERATSFEALRERNPTFAVGRDQGAAWHRAAAAVRTFRASYRAALERWCAGVRNARSRQGRGGCAR